MAHSKIVARPITTTNKKRALDDEYEYYKMYVKASVKPRKNSASWQYLELNTALFRMLEILLEKFHDMDARHSIAGDIVFHTVALSQALNIDLYLEDGKGMEMKRKNATIYASDLCLNAKTTSSAFLNTQKDPMNRTFRNQLNYELTELVDATNMACDVENLHELLIINLQRGGKADKLLEERFNHIKSNTYLKTHLESFTIYPLLYSLPVQENGICTLFKKAGVDSGEFYFYLQDIADKVYAYAMYLMNTENMTKQMVEKLFTKVIAKNNFMINIDDCRSLICPIGRSLKREPFATMWNTKYYHHGYLITAPQSPTVSDRCHSLRNQILDKRAPEGWNLENFLTDCGDTSKVNSDCARFFRNTQSENEPSEMRGPEQPEDRRRLLDWEQETPTEQLGASARSWFPQGTLWQPLLPDTTVPSTRDGGTVQQQSAATAAAADAHASAGSADYGDIHSSAADNNMSE